MKWTKERPTEPGTYWFRVTRYDNNCAAQEPELCYVHATEGNVTKGLMAFNRSYPDDSEYSHRVSRSAIESQWAEWAGPLTPPTDAEGT